MKTEGLTEMRDGRDRKIVSCYYIKTLMLWAGELNPTKWWRELNVITFAQILMRTLANWLLGGRIQHYFVDKGNICGYTANREHEIISCISNVSNRLIAISANLTNWFVDY